MAACRQLGFDLTGNSAIRSAGPENPTLEPNMTYRITLCGDTAIRLSINQSITGRFNVA